MEHIEKVLSQAESSRLLRRWLSALVIVFFMIIVFATLAEDVWSREGFGWDIPIMLAIHQVRNPALDTFMYFVTHMGQAGAITIAILLAGWLWSRQRPVESLAVLAAVNGAAAINFLLKLFFARPRPQLFLPLVVESGFSFPSGHVAASVAAYGFLALVLWQQGYRGWALCSAAWVFLVAISCIYLGGHYPSDTIAAMASTGLWMTAVLCMQSRYLRSMKQS